MPKKILIILLFTMTGLRSQTIVPDLSNVSGNWTLSGSPYLVQGRATVPAGQTLIIAAGVEIRFNSNISIYNSAVWTPDTNAVGSLRVNGKIIANGTATDSISFVAAGSGYWGSLFIPSGSTGLSAFSYCKFKNMFTINGYNSSLGVIETFRGLDYERNTNFTLLHDLFESNQYTIQTYGGALKLTLGNCSFKNNTDNINPFPMSTNIYEPAYIYNSIFNNSPLTGSDLTIVNSIFMNNDSTAIIPFSPVPSSCKIINSLFFNNHKAFSQANYLTIYNSVFLNNVTYDTCSCPWVLNNCVFDMPIVGTWSTTTVNYGNTNPNLINPLPVNGDFHLQSSSICINAGDTTGISSLIPLTDLDGNPRYNGSIDIGPYEYQGTLNMEKAEITNLNVYPNPANNYLKINCGLNPGVCRLQDVLGNTIKTIELKNKEETIDVSDLPDGIYFVSVKATEGVFTKKIIIQR